MKNLIIAVILILFTLTFFVSQSLALNLLRPSNLEAKIDNSGSSILTWQKVAKAKYYRVRLTTAERVLIKKWNKVTINTLQIDSYLEVEKEYMFKVQGCRNKKCGLWSKYENFNTDGYTKNQNKDKTVCESDTFNCADFSTQKEAQEVYDLCLGQTSSDVHDLDRDNNGLACESLN